MRDSGTERHVAFDRVEQHLYHLADSKARDSARLVIRDSAAFARLWSHIGGAAYNRPLPRVNFARSMVVATTLGQQMYVGASIRIDSMHVRASEVEIDVLTFWPEDSCALPAAVDSPVDVVVAPRSELPVTFRETRLIAERCGGRTARDSP